MLKRMLGVTIVVFGFAALATSADRWIHIHVTEAGPDGDRVRVNIPLSLAEAVLPVIKTDQLRNGKLKIDGHELDQVDVRAVLEAVSKAQDNQFVTVESKDQNVEVAKAGEFLLIKVHENHAAAAKSAPKAPNTVDIKLPFKVVHALLGGGTNELDVLAAVRALGEYANVELVTVKDGHDNVRIWVDSRNDTN